MERVRDAGTQDGIRVVKSELRIGIVGLGRIAQEHLRGWQDWGVERPVSLHVFDPGLDIATPPDVRRHADLESLLDCIDLVDICTPSDTHAGLIALAAPAGVPIICETPIALSVADALDAARACQDAGVPLLVGHVARYQAEYAAAHAQWETGRYGTPAVLRFRRAGAMSSRAWLADRERSGGVVMDLMIHDIDLAQWFAGEVVRVHATLRSRDQQGRAAHCLAILTHASGALTHLTASWALTAGFETSFEICGTRGMLSYNSATDRSWTADSPALRTTWCGGASPVSVEMRDLAAAALTGSPQRVGPSDAVAAVAVATAITASAATGKAQVPQVIPDDLVAPVALSARLQADR